MTRKELKDALHILGNKPYGRVCSVDAILEHDQAQRAVIDQLNSLCKHHENIAQRQQETCEQQAKRIQELEERLCIDYCYVHNPNDPTNPTKQMLTEDQKKTFPDKIYCLEADVQLRDEKIEQQAKELERLQTVNKDWQREFKGAVDSYKS